MDPTGSGLLCRVAAWAALAVVSGMACARGSERRADGASVVVPADAGRQASGPDVASRPRLFDEARIEALRDEFLEQAAANRTRVCRRPVLRGETLPGPADDDLLAIVADTGPAAACRAAVYENGRVLVPLTRFIADSVPAGTPRRSPPPARPLDQPLGEFGEVFEMVEAACAGLPEAIRRAVGHEDACNPYLPGRRAMPRMREQVNVARAAGLLARRSMREGRLEEAGRLLMDALRLGQDFGRGGSWIGPMISTVAIRVLAGDVELLFNAPSAFPEGLAASLQAELTALLSSEPHPSEYFADDCLQVVLQDLLPSLMPAGWTPPGGWDVDKGPPNTVTGEGEASGDGEGNDVAPRDARALALLATRSVRERFLSACPRESTREACIDGIAAAVAALGDSFKTMVEGHELLEAALQPNPDGAALREQVVRLLVDATAITAMEMLARFPRETQTRTFWLAALRLHAAFRAATDAAGSCPTLAAFDEEPLLSARGDAPVGRLLQVDAGEASETYVVTIARPLWTPRPEDDATESHPFLLLRCPGARELPALPVPTAPAETVDAASRTSARTGVEEG
ncbi:MAG: hypothetical protein HY907_22375 [Deltaproteobacteria bacterium]|nr:hypothetical protein [Deltaproteobacteria bacterium]